MRRRGRGFIDVSRGNLCVHRVLYLEKETQTKNYGKHGCYYTKYVLFKRNQLTWNEKV